MIEETITDDELIELLGNKGELSNGYHPEKEFLSEETDEEPYVNLIAIFSEDPFNIRSVTSDTVFPFEEPDDSLNPDSVSDNEQEGNLATLREFYMERGDFIKSNNGHHGDDYLIQEQYGFSRSEARLLLAKVGKDTLDELLLYSTHNDARDILRLFNHHPELEDINDEESQYMFKNYTPISVLTNRGTEDNSSYHNVIYFISNELFGSEIFQESDPTNGLKSESLDETERHFLSLEDASSKIYVEPLDKDDTSVYFVDSIAKKSFGISLEMVTNINPQIRFNGIFEVDAGVYEIVRPDNNKI